jgi:hypothetical protein
MVGSVRTVQDSLGGIGIHRQPQFLTVHASEDRALLENESFDQDELLPQQRLGDIDQLQYHQVMASRDKDQADQTRKLDTRSPVAGSTKHLLSNKFLKNHRGLDFDNVSNMQVENMPGALSPAAQETPASLSNSPIGSTGKGDSRMESTDALQ